MEANERNMRRWEAKTQVFAHEITAIEPHQDGSAVLHIGHGPDSLEAHMGPAWLETHQPRVGTYYVLVDGEAGIMSRNVFDLTFRAW